MGWAFLHKGTLEFLMTRTYKWHFVNTTNLATYMRINHHCKFITPDINLNHLIHGRVGSGSSISCIVKVVLKKMHSKNITQDN